MNEKEFLQQAVSKIHGNKDRQAVIDELHDHILLSKQRFMEMGYSEEDVEEKTIDAMGDANEIADHLGRLHNSRSVWPDIIALILSTALNSAAYYTLSEFAFGDPGVLSLLICGIFFSAAVFFAFAAFESKRRSINACIALISGSTSLTLIRLITEELSRLTDGSFEHLKNYLFNGELYISKNQESGEMLNTVLLFFGVLFAAVGLFILVYAIKKELNKYTKPDNKINQITTAVCVVLFAVSAVVSAYFGISTIGRIDALKNEYTAAFQFVAQMEQNCLTQQDVLDYIEQSDYGFETYGNETIENLKYGHNLVYINIDFYTETTDENDPEDLTSDPFGYKLQYEYKAEISTQVNGFDKKYDSITLSRFTNNCETMNDIYSFLPYEHTKKERYEYLAGFVPNRFSARKCNREFSDCEYEFEYIEKDGVINDTHYFDFTTETQELLEFEKREAEIVDILKNTDLSDPEEIARSTETTAVHPDFSREEYEDLIYYAASSLGEESETYKNRDQMLDLYDSFIEYQINDDWRFTLYRFDDDDIVIFDNGFNPIYSILSYMFDEDYDNSKEYYIKEFDLNGNLNYYTFVSEPFRKVAVENGFFDRNRLYYENELKIKYYSEDGKTYRYYSDIDEEEPDEDNRKKYYLQDNEGNIYPAEKCFIDSDGYVVIDSDSNIRQISSDKYKNSSGEIVTPVFETSWDENGNIINFDDYV